MVATSGAMSLSPMSVPNDGRPLRNGRTAEEVPGAAMWLGRRSKSHNGAEWAAGARGVTL